MTMVASCPSSRECRSSNPEALAKIDLDLGVSRVEESSSMPGAAEPENAEFALARAGLPEGGFKELSSSYTKGMFAKDVTDFAEEGSSDGVVLPSESCRSCSSSKFKAEYAVSTSSEYGAEICPKGSNGRAVNAAKYELRPRRVESDGGMTS